MTVLETKALTRRFGALTAVDALTISVEASEVFGLLGPNGAGKSTVIKFASNAIYPISMMPRWLQVISHGNPLTYEVDSLRALMLAGGVSTFGLGVDFGVLLAATAVVVVIGGWIYPRVVT